MNTKDNRSATTAQDVVAAAEAYLARCTTYQTRREAEIRLARAKQAARLEVARLEVADAATKAGVPVDDYCGLLELAEANGLGIDAEVENWKQNQAALAQAEQPKLITYVVGSSHLGTSPAAIGLTPWVVELNIAGWTTRQVRAVKLLLDEVWLVDADASLDIRSRSPYNPWTPCSYSNDVELKQFEAKLNRNSVSLFVVTGSRNDEGKLTSLFLRTTRHLFIGPAGGVSTVTSSGRIVAGRRAFSASNSTWGCRK